MNEKTNSFLRWTHPMKKSSLEKDEEIQKRKDKIDELMKMSAISSGSLMNRPASPLAPSTVWTGGLDPISSNTVINTIPLSHMPYVPEDCYSRKKPENIFQEILVDLFDKQEMVQYIMDNGGKIIDNKFASFKKDGMGITSDIHTIFYEMIKPKFKTMLLSKQVLKFKI